MTNLEEEAFYLLKKDNPNWISQYPTWDFVPENERNQYVLRARRVSTEMGNNEGKVEDTLKARGNIYGSYEEVCKTRSYIMNVLEQHHAKVKGTDMNETQKVAFGDIVLKLVRAAGAPEYSDSFHDLGGYAKLMEDMANEN